MRIVGGDFSGRRLAEPRTPKSGVSPIRPTTDRVRESLFNILANRFEIEDRRVIDLFAGTGALGIEAISRGAAFCLFVETSSEGRRLVQENLETLGLLSRARLSRLDARKMGGRGSLEPFDLVFADPPYGKGLGERALSGLLEQDWMSDDVMIVLEEAATSPPHAIDGLKVVDQRPFGNTVMTFMTRS